MYRRCPLSMDMQNLVNQSGSFQDIELKQNSDINQGSNYSVTNLQK